MCQQIAAMVSLWKHVEWGVAAWQAMRAATKYYMRR
jgi:hypothetical protein